MISWFRQYIPFMTEDRHDRLQGDYNCDEVRPRHRVVGERIPTEALIDEERLDGHMDRPTDHTMKLNVATEDSDDLNRYGKPSERESKSKEVRARGDETLLREGKVERSSERTKSLARDLNRAKLQVKQLTTDNAAKDSTIKDLRNQLAAKDREIGDLTKSGDLAKQRMHEHEALSHKRGNELEALRLSFLRTQRLLDTRNSELQSAEIFLDRADSMPGAEIVKMADALNSEIFQTAALMADAFVELDQKIPREGPGTTPESFEARGRVSPILGDPMVCLLLRTHGEDDVMLLQIAVQVILASQSSRIIRSWSLSDAHLDRALNRIYEMMRDTEAQSVFGKWRALTQGNIQRAFGQSSEVDATTSLIANILVLISRRASFFDALGAVQRFGERLTSVAQMAIQLNMAIRMNITSADIQPILYHFNERFEPNQMDDTHASARHPHKDTRREDFVLGTTDLGLARWEKSPTRVFDYVILLRPKVALQSVITSSRGV